MKRWLRRWEIGVGCGWGECILDMSTNRQEQTTLRHLGIARPRHLYDRVLISKNHKYTGYPYLWHYP